MVYDVTSEKSFEQLNNWREEFLRQAGPRDPENFPFIVIGNKIDKDTERRVPKANALQWCKSKRPTAIPYFETSAKEAIQVEAAFLEVAQLALQQDTAESDVFIPDTISFSKPQQSSAKADNSSCC